MLRSPLAKAGARLLAPVVMPPEGSEARRSPRSSGIHRRLSSIFQFKKLF